MEEKIEVLFGRSFIYPETIVIEKVWRVGYHEDDQGNTIGPEYNAQAESWMARTDMSCSVFAISESSFYVLSEKYTEFIKASWEEPCDEEKANRLKEEFFEMALS